MSPATRRNPPRERRRAGLDLGDRRPRLAEEFLLDDADRLHAWIARHDARQELSSEEAGKPGEEDGGHGGRF